MNWIKIDPKDEATWPVCEDNQLVLLGRTDRADIEDSVYVFWFRNELAKEGRLWSWTHWLPITPPEN